MRPLQKLTFDAFRDGLSTTFTPIADKRDPRRITPELLVVLMSAFAMLFFQHPSLWEYQRRMQQRTGRSNLERVFAVEELPSDTQWNHPFQETTKTRFRPTCSRSYNKENFAVFTRKDQLS